MKVILFILFVVWFYGVMSEVFAKDRKRFLKPLDRWETETLAIRDAYVREQRNKAKCLKRKRHNKEYLYATGRIPGTN